MSLTISYQEASLLGSVGRICNCTSPVIFFFLGELDFCSMFNCYALIIANVTPKFHPLFPDVSYLLMQELSGKQSLCDRFKQQVMSPFLLLTLYDPAIG